LNDRFLLYLLPFIIVFYFPGVALPRSRFFRKMDEDRGQGPDQRTLPRGAAQVPGSDAGAVRGGRSRALALPEGRDGVGAARDGALPVPGDVPGVAGPGAAHAGGPGPEAGEGADNQGEARQDEGDTGGLFGKN